MDPTPHNLSQLLDATQTHKCESAKHMRAQTPHKQETRKRTHTHKQTNTQMNKQANKHLYVCSCMLNRVFGWTSNAGAASLLASRTKTESICSAYALDDQGETQRGTQ